MYFNELTGKTALITGASRGIGLEIAKHLGKLGVKIAIAASTLENALKAQQLLKDEQIDVIALAANIADKSAATNLVNTAIEKLGHLDILINNAAMVRDNFFILMKDEQWEQVINTNLNSQFYITKTAVKHMIKRRTGKIVFISSVVGFTGNAGQVNYSASKSALFGFCKSLALELAPRNISCNIVAPGFIETDMTINLASEIKNAILERIPVKRMGQVGDIAKGVVFLCSPMADYITGTTLHINGGMY